MSAVVTRPSRPRPGGKALIFCQAGLQNKSGAGDYFRWLADALAEAGHVVVRFDPLGTGDSPGEIARDIPLDQFFVKVQDGVSVDDTVDAIRWTRAQEPGREVYLWGQCGGSVTATLACARAPEEVAGLVLLATPVLYSRSLETVRSFDAKMAREGYVRKLLKPRAWLHLLGGKSEYRLLLAAALSVLAQARKHPRGRSRNQPMPDHPLFNHKLHQGFCAVMRAGKPVLFLNAELDNETPEFNDEFKAKVLDPRPEYQRLCAVKSLARADHSLMFMEGRRLSRDVILAWLDARHR